MKLPKVTLDGIITFVFIVGLIANLVGLAWLMVAFVWFTYTVFIPLGVFVSGLLLMSIAYGISLLVGTRDQ